ncbi:MAG: GHKL domain-containing protein [Nitrospiraceae bacterium]|nr:MAG: GHKL domain-containing protein [Nitrospiraceae bacterium]
MNDRSFYFKLKTFRYSSPYIAMSIIALAVVLCEITAMIIIHVIPSLSESEKNIVNLLTLVTFSTPIIYFFLVRPLMKYNADPMNQTGEQFNSMTHVPEQKNIESEIAYRDLKETQSQMLQREKMASIGKLAAGVAHEINNPMGFISSNMNSLGTYTKKITEFIHIQEQALMSVNFPELTKEVEEQKKKLKVDFILDDIGQLLEESIEGADRVTKIVQNLKSFSRVDESEHNLANINDCMESTLNIVWNELKYKATVTKDYGDIPMTMCYPLQLNQVFVNLLVNASHAIETQGEIRIKTWNGNGLVNISVSDTGRGIEKDKIKKIFEPFFTTKPEGEGTGLGLSITYDIIKKHRGDISVDSEVGKGTTFHIKIPVTGVDNDE